MWYTYITNFGKHLQAPALLTPLRCSFISQEIIAQVQPIKICQKALICTMVFYNK